MTGNDARPTTELRGRMPVLRIIVSVLAIGVGLFLLLAPTAPAIADGVFVGSIALLLAVYIWPGLPANTARLVAIVLILLAAYAFIRGFGLLELAILRQIGGAAAVLSGLVLLIPAIRGRVAKSAKPEEG